MPAQSGRAAEGPWCVVGGHGVFGGVVDLEVL